MAWVGSAPILFALHAALMAGVVAQVLPASRSESSVRTLPVFSSAAPAGGQIELTVRWVAGQAPAGTMTTSRAAADTNRFEVRRRAAVDDPPVRERDPQLAEDELVIVALDAQGREVGWQHLKDPRIVRSEQPGFGGRLRGRTLFRAEAELIVRVPQSLGAATLNLYEVAWTGSAFVLRGCGSIPIR